MRHTYSHSHPRRASITIVVLVCLVVVTLICASLLRLSRSQRALMRSEERWLQADWLAESGLERASARLGADPAYHGETWSIPADALGGAAPGVVTINVDRDQAAPNQRLVTVQADYPSNPEQRVRSRRQAVVDVSP